MNQPMPHPQTIDPSVFEELRVYAKSSGFLSQVLDIFEQHARTSLEELGVAAAAQDREALIRVAHRIKGSCMNVGASQMAEILQSFEELLDLNKPLDQVPSQLTILQEAFEETCKALKSLI